ncbi:uncharacterized protein METZ01_LOCUS449553, partial [marine metagenome]
RAASVDATRARGFRLRLRAQHQAGRPGLSPGDDVGSRRGAVDQRRPEPGADPAVRTRRCGAVDIDRLFPVGGDCQRRLPAHHRSGLGPVSASVRM